MSELRFEFYGRLASLADQTSIDLPTDLPIRLQDALTQLAEQLPQIHDNLERCACAVGDQLVHRDLIIQDKMTIALLPPVAGG